MQPEQRSRDKMLRGNSVHFHAPTFPRTTVVSRETLAKVESRDSLVDSFVGSRPANSLVIPKLLSRERKIVRRQSRCIFIVAAVVASCISVVRAGLVAASSRFQANGEFQYALFL